MPDWRAEVRPRLTTARLSPTREAEIVEELSQDLEDRWQALVAAGTPPEEATRLALAAFREGNVLGRRLGSLRQAHWHDSAPLPTRRFSTRGLGADLRQAIRALRASPGFTVAALLVLTLGIGATTAIFSIVDAVVLRGLPFEDSSRLVAAGERRVAPGAKSGPASPLSAAFGGVDPQALRIVQPQNYLDWARMQTAFDSIAAIANGEFTLVTPGSEPEAVLAQRVTASFFDVLRVRPARGRVFTTNNEVGGRDLVAVLSDSFWRRRFAGNPNIVGQTISLDGQNFEVIGVMPAEFSYPPGALKSAALWVPYVVPPNERVRGRGHSMYLQSIARLRPGVTVDQADVQMSRIAAALERANPEWNRGFGAGARPLRDHVVGASIRSWMLMLLVAVGIVLLIACANVANLLMARATTRQREIAVRAALGAGRARLVRQFLVESLVLSTCGAALAVLAAWWAIAVLKLAMPEEVPRAATIGLDLRVLAAACALAVATGVLCGILPAFQSSKPNLTTALNQSTRAGGTGRVRQRLRSVLVVAELALAVVLVVASALFVGSFIRVMRIDPGLDPEGVLTMQVYQRTLPGRPPMDLSSGLVEIVDRLSRTPGIATAAAGFPGLPLRPNQHIDGFGVRGATLEGDTAVSIKEVTTDYFKTLGIRLRRGRLFTQADASGAEKVLIINDAAAKQFFPSGDPLGRAAVVSNADRTIVGIVGDARQDSLEAPAMPEVYLPFTLNEIRPSAFFAVRTTGDPYRLLPAVRAAVLQVLPNMPLRNVATMNDLMTGLTAKRRLTMLMLGLFGVLGLAIAAVGIYGVIAYLVAQRTHEIGVRMALGATRTQVVGMVVARAAVLVAIGVSLGTAGAWYFGGVVRAFLFGLEPNDGRAFAAAAAALSASALVACVVPARRASRVDPVVALRAE